MAQHGTRAETRMNIKQAGSTQELQFRVNVSNDGHCLTFEMQCLQSGRILATVRHPWETGWQIGITDFSRFASDGIAYEVKALFTRDE